jgi:hypothetical protein
VDKEDPSKTHRKALLLGGGWIIPSAVESKENYDYGWSTMYGNDDVYEEKKRFGHALKSVITVFENLEPRKLGLVVFSGYLHMYLKS